MLALTALVVAVIAGLLHLAASPAAGLRARHRLRPGQAVGAGLRRRPIRVTCLDVMQPAAALPYAAPAGAAPAAGRLAGRSGSTRCRAPRSALVQLRSCRSPPVWPSASLIAGIGSILVSLLVICFGVAGRGRLGRLGGRRVHAARRAGRRRRRSSLGLLALRQIRRLRARRRAGAASPAAAWRSAGHQRAGGRRGGNLALLALALAIAGVAAVVPRPGRDRAATPRQSGHRGQVAGAGERPGYTVRSRTMSIVRTGPFVLTCGYGGYSFPSCPGLPGQLVRAPEPESCDGAQPQTDGQGVASR